MTPLMTSVFYGYADTVKYLVDQGASLNLLNSEGKTALAIAREQRRAKIVEILENKRKIDL